MVVTQDAVDVQTLPLAPENPLSLREKLQALRT